MNKDEIAEIRARNALGDCVPEEVDALCDALEERRSICDEIQEIMATYREQEAKGRIDTPGGLEHMGDVWRLLGRWDEALRRIDYALKTPSNPRSI